MTEQEIAELQQRVAALEARNAPKGAAVPPVHPASGASVSHPRSEVLADARMPRNTELAQLLAIVQNDYPSLRPDHGKDFNAFRMAARWLLDVKRGNLDLAHTVRFWADRAQGFSIFHSMKVEISGNILLCAAIAAGDVDFIDPDFYPCNLMHLSLREGYGGRSANSQAWRRILATGKAPAASNYRPREYERGAVIIRCAK